MHCVNIFFKYIPLNCNDTVNAIISYNNDNFLRTDNDNYCPAYRGIHTVFDFIFYFLGPIDLGTKHTISGRYTLLFKKLS